MGRGLWLCGAGPWAVGCGCVEPGHGPWAVVVWSRAMGRGLWLCGAGPWAVGCGCVEPGHGPWAVVVVLFVSILPCGM